MPIHYLLPVTVAPFRWFWKVLGLLSLLLLSRAGQAQIYNGPGAIFYQGGDVSTTGAFQNAGTYVPQAGTLALTNGDLLNSGTINPGTATVALVSGSARTLALNGQTLPNLSLNVPAGTTLTSSGTISNTLQLLSGHLLTTGANTLTLAPAAAVLGETSAGYVKGHVNQSQMLAGSAPVDFGQTGFVVNPGGQSFPLTVDRRAGLLTPNVSQGQNIAGSNQGIDRLWALSSPSTITTPVSITLSWLSDNDNGLSLTSTNAQVWRSDNNGGQWVKQNAAGDGTGRSLSMSTTQLNALYTVSTTAKPLPVELLSITATNVGGAGHVAWQTASETNSAFMEVQGSGDGQRWQVLGQVAGAGTSPSGHAYSFLDPKLSRYGTAQVYYRLRLVDRDGSAGYSPLVSVRVDPGALAAFGVRAWPNPFATGLTVQVQTPEAGDVSLTVLDGVGRTVLTRTVRGLLAGTQELNLDETGALPSGSYTLLARQGNRLATLHLVHQ